MGSIPEFFMYNRFMKKKHLTREECLALLHEHHTPEHVIRHCMEVSKVAVSVGKSLKSKELRLDLGLIRSSGMLHDIARVYDEHWNVGADILLSMGYEEEAGIIRQHMTYTMTTKVLEIRELDLVCLGDRTVLEDKYVGLERRMEYVFEKVKNNPMAIEIITAKKAQTEELIVDIETHIGMTMDDLMNSRYSKTFWMGPSI